MKQTLLLIACFLMPHIFGTVPKSETINVVIFDFGNCIATTDRVPILSFLQKNLNLSSEEETLNVLVQLRRSREKNISDEKFWAGYEKDNNLALPKDWNEQLERIYLSCILVNQEMIDIVLGLKRNGYKVAMLSNTTPFQANLIRKLGTYSYFDPVALSYEIGAEKPDPKAYFAVVKMLHLLPNQCIFIDDKIENVEAARILGFDAILFESPIQLKNEFQKQGILYQ